MISEDKIDSFETLKKNNKKQTLTVVEIDLQHRHYPSLFKHKVINSGNSNIYSKEW